MSVTLEKRIEELERKFSELAEQNAASKKNWQKTFGFSRRDEGFEDLIRLGETYRRGLGKGNVAQCRAA